VKSNSTCLSAKCLLGAKFGTTFDATPPYGETAQLGEIVAESGQFSEAICPSRSLLRDLGNIYLYHVQLPSHQTLEPTTVVGICITNQFAQSIDNGEDASDIICISPQKGPRDRLADQISAFSK
jgi:hypothetical protein